MRQNKNTRFSNGGSGLDRTDDFQKFWRSGLDRIQFFRIRTGLELKIFHSPLISDKFISVCCYTWKLNCCLMIFHHVLVLLLHYN